MMRFEELPVHVRQEVENALLPGEEVRYVTRPRSRTMMTGGAWALLAFAIAWNSIMLTVVGLVVWSVLWGEEKAATLVSVYAGVLIFFQAGYMIMNFAMGDARHLRRSLYLVTNRRVMILRPRDMLLSYPLRKGIIRQVKARADGSGTLYFETGEKQEAAEEESLDSGCFAFVPEMRRVEALINELAVQVPLMPEMKCPDPDFGALKPASLSRLQESLEPGEVVQWVGCSQASAQMQSVRMRRRYGAWALVNLLGVACAVVSAGEKLGILVMGFLYLVIAACFLLLLFGYERSAYAITNKRVCYIRPKKVSTLSRELTAIEHHSGGAVSISLKTYGEIPECMACLSSSLPALILLGNQFPEQ